MKLRAVWVLVTAVLVAGGSRAESPIAQFYYVDDAPSLESLYSHYSAINLVSPAWLTLVDGGEIRSAVDKHVLDWAAKRHVNVMPVLLNDSFRPEIAHFVLASDAQQEKVIADLLKLLAGLKVHGIQLDLENIPAADRTAYSRFAAKVCGRLAMVKMTCSVAVPAPLTPDSPPEAGQPKWRPNENASAFDYAALAQATSFLTLMTYDEYTSPDQPGPIAGYPWVEACIRQILESVPSRKVLLGVPLYHRLWTGKKVSEGPSAHATELAGQWRSTPVFDPIQQELMARSQNGETLDVVWYQNSESLRKRLDLVKKYRLRGFSAWRLGQEPPEIWKDVFVRRPGTRS